MFESIECILADLTLKTNVAKKMLTNGHTNKKQLRKEILLNETQIMLLLASRHTWNTEETPILKFIQQQMESSEQRQIVLDMQHKRSRELYKIEQHQLGIHKMEMQTYFDEQLNASVLQQSLLHTWKTEVNSTLEFIQQKIAESDNRKKILGKEYIRSLEKYDKEQYDLGMSKVRFKYALDEAMTHEEDLPTGQLPGGGG
jgi:nicotinamide mononucleotide adenylyltransferase